jgi:hypothetical protein
LTVQIVMAELVPAISMRIAPCLPDRDRRDEPGDDTEPFRLQLLGRR